MEYDMLKKSEKIHLEKMWGKNYGEFLFEKKEKMKEIMYTNT
jgi:hypothetical protein